MRGIPVTWVGWCSINYVNQIHITKYILAYLDIDLSAMVINKNAEQLRDSGRARDSENMQLDIA